MNTILLKKARIPDSVLVAGKEKIGKPDLIIPSLNGLRAISIMMVIAGHLYANHFLFENKLTKVSVLFLFNGQLAVNIFFIISGFLITTLLVKEQDLHGKISLKKFYVRRTLRIFPAYYFYIMIVVCLSLKGIISLNSSDLYGALTFTRQFFVSHNPELGHLWSLSVEECFYLLWPCLFMLFKNKIIWPACMLMIAITIGRILQFGFPSPELGNTIFSTGDAILIGCLVAIKYEQISKWVVQQKKLIYIALPILVMSVIISSYTFHLLSIISPLNKKLFFIESIFYGLFGNIGLITNFAIAFVIVFSINLRNTWFRFLNSPVMNHLGKLSYSLYLWQQLFTLDKAGLHQIPLIVLLLLIYAVAYSSYYLIEKPILKWKQRYA